MLCTPGSQPVAGYQAPHQKCSCCAATCAQQLPFEEPGCGYTYMYDPLKYLLRREERGREEKEREKREKKEKRKKRERREKTETRDKGKRR